MQAPSLLRLGHQEEPSLVHPRQPIQLGVAYLVLRCLAKLSVVPQQATRQVSLCLALSCFQQLSAVPQPLPSLIPLRQLSLLPALQIPLRCQQVRV